MRQHQPLNRAQAGFTLTEMMFAIAVAGIVLGLAVPNFTRFQQNSRLTSAANDMLTTIHMTRTEAIKRRLPTAFCFTTTPNAATPACNGTGREGWISWVDADNDFVVDATNEPVIARHEALHSTVNVRTQPSGNSGYIGYMPSGFLRVSSTDFTSAVICDSRGTSALYSGGPSAARGLQIGTTGRPGITRTTGTITTLLAGGTCP